MNLTIYSINRLSDVATKLGKCIQENNYCDYHAEIDQVSIITTSFTALFPSSLYLTLNVYYGLQTFTHKRNYPNDKT